MTALTIVIFYASGFIPFVRAGFLTIELEYSIRASTKSQSSTECCQQHVIIFPALSWKWACLQLLAEGMPISGSELEIHSVLLWDLYLETF